MKMKIFNKKRYSILALSLTALMFSCSDYLDVDKDKDNPTVAPLDLLLSNTQVALGNATDFQLYTGDILAVYTHQMVVREEQDQYGTKVGNALMQNEWDNIYLTLTDLESLINQGTESGDMIYVGIGQLEKAYLMSVAVDLWGDVPYTEATKLKEGIISPKFDKQEEIYASILELIETGKANIASGEGDKPSTDDLFYGGRTAQWIKFANSYKMKLYNQIRLTSLYNATDVAALLSENNFFSSIDDDFEFDHFSAQSPSDERNKFFQASYLGTQFSTYQSPWFYEILKGVNPSIHTGNEDPRIPYYFFNQMTAGQFPPDQGDEATGDPNADYWDAATGFFSIRFGSIGPNRDGNVENSATYPGIFPAGGRYDDGQGGVVDELNAAAGTRPTGIAPHRIFTYDEFLYVQAEMALVGLIPGDAGAKLEQAMNASFAKVDEVVVNNKAPQTIPALVGSPAVTAFIANIMTEYTAASAIKKLEILITQKWVATFGDPADQYNDYRRTGFPVLANPLGASPEYQIDNGDGFPIIDSQTVQNNPFQLSLYWPQGELNSNQNAPAQKTPGTYNIFWDVN